MPHFLREGKGGKGGGGQILGGGGGRGIFLETRCSGFPQNLSKINSRQVRFSLYLFGAAQNISKEVIKQNNLYLEHGVPLEYPASAKYI